MRHKLFIAAYLLLILFFGKITCKLSATCPNPSVKKRTIIRSDESINNGARLIGKDIVTSARNCYQMCCDDLSCNVAVMHYKEKYNALGEAITEKYCFLFSCGSPSVCTYEEHHRYAIIDLGSRKDELYSAKKDDENTATATTTTTTITTTSSTTTTTPPPTTKEIPPTTTTVGIIESVAPTRSELPISLSVVTTPKVHASISKEGKNECNEVCAYNYDPVCGTDGMTYDNKCLFKAAQCKTTSLKMDYDEPCRECPPGVPMAMCSDDPCEISSCPTNKDAVCKANFCGGCNAIYYDKEGSKVNCSRSGVAVSQIHNEQSVTVSEADYEETTDEDSLIHLGGGNNTDPYYSGDKRKWLESKPTNASSLDSSKIPVVVVVKESTSSLMSLPLLVALIICIILLIGVIYRVKCASRGRAKKLPVDDGDYLINGMYL